MAGLVYTANFDGYDIGRPVGVAPEKDVHYWMVSDSKQSPEGWDLQPYQVGEHSALRRAREIKVMAPVLWPQFDWYLWMDATMQLCGPVWKWAEKLMHKGATIAAFRHNEWDCAYREIEACREREKDTKANLDKAWGILVRTGHLHHYGQAATGFLWRGGCDEVRQHALEWWGQMKQTTMRDQCTFMNAARIVDVDVEFLPGLHTKNKLMHYQRGHQK